MSLPVLRHSSLPQPVPRVVLDTNVVLDWLFFTDSRCGALDRAIRSGGIRWLANASLRDELDHVVARGIVRSGIGGGKGPRSVDAVHAGWDAWADMAEIDPAPAPHPLRCRDPDDQKFIDFALHARATCLLSRDRAVLALARAAARFGLQILSIDRWTAASALP